MSEPLSELLVVNVSKFPLGNLVATPGVLESIPHEEIQTAFNRHANGDWGPLDEEDRESNDRALVEGTRLLSAYESQRGNTLLDHYRMGPERHHNPVTNGVLNGNVD